VGGINLFATVDTGTNQVRLYDLTNPTAPVFLTLGNNTTGTPVANANFAGDVRFGEIVGNTATLYALNTNNGIQAFTITVVPEPSTVSLLGFAAGGLAFRRRR
jgi:hypothetical protein